MIHNRKSFIICTLLSFQIFIMPIFALNDKNVNYFGNASDYIDLINQNYSEGLYVVDNGMKRGAIDKAGKLIIPFIYDAISPFSEGVAVVGKDIYTGNNSYSLIDKTGKEVLKLDYSYVGSFSEGLAIAYKDGKHGYINKSGKLVIPLVYFHANDFSEGLALVTKGGKWGYIDKNGNAITGFVYDYAADFHGGLAWVCKKDSSGDKFGYINKNGKEVTPITYTWASNLSEGLGAFKKGNGKTGYIDKTGKEVLLFDYHGVDDFSEGLTCVVKDGKYGFINKTGKVVIPISYKVDSWSSKDNWSMFVPAFRNGLAAVKKNEKYGFIDKTGKAVLPFIYDDAYGFINGLSYVVLNGKHGIIDKSGKMIITLSSITEQYAFVVNNGKIGVIKEKYLDPNFKDTPSMSYILPVDMDIGDWTAITYGGDENTKGGHWGTEFRAIDLNLANDKDNGQEVKAIADGMIVRRYDSYGHVTIKHSVPLVLENGERTYNTWYSTYAHMKDLKFKQGDIVKQGDILGYISNTSPSQPMVNHLHFSITTKLGNGEQTVTDDIAGRVFNVFTISPLWLGEDYKKIKYQPFSNDDYDADAVARLKGDVKSNAPKNN